MTSPTATVAPCTRCGSFVDPKDCLYSDDGEAMCLPCREHLDDVVREKRASRTLRNTGYTSAFMGAVGLPAALFLPLGAFFTSGPAIAAGWRVLHSLARNPKARVGLSWHLGPVVVASGSGVLFGLIGIALMAFHFASLIQR